MAARYAMGDISSVILLDFYPYHDANVFQHNIINLLYIMIPKVKMFI